MADETPVVESAASSTESSAAAEPQTPEWEWTGDKSAVEQLAREGYENVQTDKLLTELAGRPEITVAELRRLPGTEGMTDEQLQAMWQQVSQPKQDRPRDEQGRFTKAEQEAQGQAAGAKPGAVQRAWKALTAEGVEVSDLSKMTGEQILALQFEYQANGKPQRKTWDEVIRNAQLGHYNGERMAEIQRQRDTTVQQYREAQQRLEAAEADKRTWMSALQAASRNDFKPLETLLQAFIDASNAPPVADGPKMVPQADIERERYGQHVYNTQVMPKATEIGQKYGIPAEDVAKGIMMIVENEPPEFFTAQRLEQIMAHDIVYAIEQMQRDNPPPPPAANTAAEVEALKAEIAELRKAQAEKHNTHIQGVHQRRNAAPPATSSIPGGASGVESPNFDGAQAARDWLRSL